MIRILPEESLIRTSEADHADWNFRPLLGWIQRARFRLIVQYLSGHHFQRLLEIGYGSGVFMPELVHYCDELYGIDPHPKNEEVAPILRKNGVDASLFCSGAESMPFSDDFFDCIVAVSAMEYVEDIRAASIEICRILQPRGLFVLVTPGHNPLVDIGLKMLTREDAGAHYADRRHRLISSLAKYFTVQERHSKYFLGLPPLQLYTSLTLQAKPNAG
jgi:ubiquinone/menaquinone biosynthesis C-methylase UbiE